MITNSKSISCENLTKLLSQSSRAENGRNNKMREKCAKIYWKNIGQIDSAVCFDVDSTVTQDEMIDQFAAFLGKNVQHVTKQAMNGSLTFRQALSHRLGLLKPTRREYGQFVENYEPKFTHRIVELIAELHRRRVPVFLVTGGFREIVHRKIAPNLGIRPERTFSNVLHFDSDGNYAGFDRSQLTSQSGRAPLGKAGVCALLKKRFGYKLLLMIGDGVTDMEARPPADFFIGFGGNQVREKVRLGADWFVMDIDEFLMSLNKYDDGSSSAEGRHKKAKRLRRSCSSIF